MCNVLKLVFILCTIPLIKGLSVKVDGGIKLGSTWNNNNLTKPNEPKESLSHQRTLDNDRLRIDEEKLRKAEVQLRKEAAEHRNKRPSFLRGGKRHRERHKDEPKSIFPLINPIFQWLTQFVRINLTLNRKQTEAPKREKKQRENSKRLERLIYNDKESENSDDNSDYSMFKSTKPMVRTPKQSTLERDSSTDVSSESHDWEDDKLWKEIISNGEATIVSNGEATSSSIEANRDYIDWTDEVGNRADTKSKTPTLEDYINAHRVGDDDEITEFTNQLYKKTMKVFDKMKKKNSEEPLRKQIKQLARNYDEKFKQFLKDTSKQTIKTRLGTQKVILSTIEMSDRILRRLLNFIMADMHQKGPLRNNNDAAYTLRKAIEVEQKQQMDRACKKFGICRSGPELSTFIVNVSSIILKLDAKKFNQTTLAITDIVKKTYLEDILGKHIDKKLRSAFEKVDMRKIKPMLVVLKNILTNKNKPLIVNNLTAQHRIVNSTIAFLEIIDLLDKKVSVGKSNVWVNMKNSLEDYSHGKRNDIYEIIEAIVNHLTDSLKSLDKVSRKIVSKNLDIILNSY